MRRAVMAAPVLLAIAPLAVAPAGAAAPSGVTLCRGSLCLEDRGEPSPGQLLTFGVDFEAGDRGFATIDCTGRIIAVSGAQTEFVADSLPDLLCRLRGHEAPAPAGAGGEAEARR